MSERIRLRGYDHVKVAVEDVSSFEKAISALGFEAGDAKDAPDHCKNPDAVWGSGEAVFCIYSAKHPLAQKHHEWHGDTIFDLSFRIENDTIEHGSEKTGIGGMKHTLLKEASFEPFPMKKGIERFDHNTVNVERGKLNESVEWYLQEFELEKGQYFDIKASQTGLYSWVTRSPDHRVQIPFNEAADPKSQIQEYIDVHRGPGVQHLAVLTKDIISTMKAIRDEPDSPIHFLDIPDTYYELVRQRYSIRESFNDLEKLRILVDQDKNGGYLLQIFTKNIIGAFFFELIQREGNQGFGEGNFQALFESMELDQKRRGVL